MASPPASGLREHDVYPSLLGVGATSRRQRGYWVGRAGGRFAVKPTTERRGGAPAPSRRLRDTAIGLGPWVLGL